MVPEGVQLSLRHFLSVNHSQEIRSALDSKDDIHKIVKVTKDKEGLLEFEIIEEFRSIETEFFSTNNLQNKPLCIITVAGSPECKHHLPKWLEITRIGQLCPHARNSLVLHCYCSGMNAEFEEEVSKRDEESTKVFMKQLIEPSEVCKVKIQLENNSEVDEFSISYFNLCQNAGITRFDVIGTGFQEIDCLSEPKEINFTTTSEKDGSLIRKDKR